MFKSHNALKTNSIVSTILIAKCLSQNIYSDVYKNKWIKVKAIADEKSLTYFLDLDKGEAETIILATEINAELVLIDETLGRYYARHSGLKITGTLGVLIRAKTSGLIDYVEPLLYQLREKGIWLGNDLMNEVISVHLFHSDNQSVMI